VSYQAETPFDSIEGSHEYVAMLAEAVEEARREVEAEVSTAERDQADRRKEALLLVSYNLAKLNLHITSSRRILNDLRTLRRLLLDERGKQQRADNEVAANGD
jgi:tRNA uridine 5-carbamoylmethylation protein Kti12